MGDRDFRNTMRKRGFMEGRNNSSRFWVGIALTTEQPSIFDDDVQESRIEALLAGIKT